MSRGLCRAGVTVVELLVVVAIIAALAGIIFGVSGGVRASVAMNGCLSNLSQIGKGVLLYAADFDDMAPPILTHATKGQVANVGPFIPVNADAEKWRDLVNRYAKAEAIFFCPAARHARSKDEVRTSDGFSTNEFTSYQVVRTEGWTLTPHGVPLLRLSQVPQVRVYARDVILRKMDPTAQYPFETAHGTRINELYTDGSAKNISLD